MDSLRNGETGGMGGLRASFNNTPFGFEFEHLFGRRIACTYSLANGHSSDMRQGMHTNTTSNIRTDERLVFLHAIQDQPYPEFVYGQTTTPSSYGDPTRHPERWCSQEAAAAAGRRLLLSHSWLRLYIFVYEP